MNNDTGGPAFPCLPPLGPDGTAAAGYPYVCGGMTLRDYFAANTLAGLSAAPAFTDSTWDVLAGMAYDAADHMLKAREAS